MTMYQLYNTFDEAKVAIYKARNDNQLHGWVQDRLRDLLKTLHPEVSVEKEVYDVPGGRVDLVLSFPAGRRAVIEVFCSSSQVPQDLRLLEQSEADIKIAVLLDKEIDQSLSSTVFHKKPNFYPFLWLSSLFLRSDESSCLSKLQEYLVNLTSEDSASTEARLAQFGLLDQDGDEFGKSQITSSLGYKKCWDAPLLPATHYVVFVAIPTERVRLPRMEVLKAAQGMLDLRTWSYPAGKASAAPKYGSLRLFEVPPDQYVVADTVRCDNRDRSISSNLVLSRLSATSAAEVVYAQAVYLVRMDQSGTPVFCIGRILAYLWSLTALVAQLYQETSYSGKTLLCAAMVNTLDSQLGCFAKGWPEPGDAIYWLDASNHDWRCHSVNLKWTQVVDLVSMRPRQQPDFIKQVAEWISMHYNYRQPRCFDRETGSIPQQYFDW